MLGSIQKYVRIFKIRTMFRFGWVTKSWLFGFRSTYIFGQKCSYFRVGGFVSGNQNIVRILKIHIFGCSLIIGNMINSTRCGHNCITFKAFLSPASQSEEGGLLNSPLSIRPSVRPFTLSGVLPWRDAYFPDFIVLLTRRGTLELRVHW